MDGNLVFFFSYMLAELLRFVQWSPLKSFLLVFQRGTKAIFFFFFFDLKVLVSKKSSIHSSVNVHVCI